jgi:hypothetical protein
MKAMNILSVAGLATLATVIPAHAHHSGAMFDNNKEVVIEGTVKEWQFVNPHSWLQIVVQGEDGKTQQWSFETGPPGGGRDSPNSTIRRDTFKPGDKVSVRAHPMRDGRPAGHLEGVTFADGRKWSPRGG